MSTGKFALNFKNQDYIFDSVSKTIKEFRKEKKLTMAGLARISGVNQQQISAIEHHRYHGRIDTIIHLADSMGKQLSFFTNGKYYDNTVALITDYLEEKNLVKKEFSLISGIDLFNLRTPIKNAFVFQRLKKVIPDFEIILVD